jgi:acyl dehydratase
MSVEKTEKSVLPEGEITDESLKKVRDRIGKLLRVDPYNTIATVDSIRHFADGVGDINPLWRDPEYAKENVYGKIIAPPSWYYSVFPTWISHSLPGVHSFHSGTDWTFIKPTYEGDSIRPECEFKGWDEKESKFAKKILFFNHEARYYNQKDELVAWAKSWSARAERKAAREKGKYFDLKLPHPWTEKELKEIDDQIMEEEIRGAEPRYWEDVNVGDELKPVIKGPIGLTDMIAMCAGMSPVKLLAHEAALHQYRKHPDWCWRDPNTFAWEPIYAVHYSIEGAKSAGVPYPYDVGAQRNTWAIHLLTNWMGNDAWLKKCRNEYRQFVYLSDVVWCKGKVVDKSVDEDREYVVTVETEAINQRNYNVMPGKAVIALPSKKNNFHPVKSRLEKK